MATWIPLFGLGWRCRRLVLLAIGSGCFLGSALGQEIGSGSGIEAIEANILVAGENGGQVLRTFEELEMRSRIVRVQAGDSISKFLLDSNIHPDMNSYGLVYDLNPTLLDVDAIGAGVRITLPGLPIGEIDSSLAAEILYVRRQRETRLELSMAAIQLQDGLAKISMGSTGSWGDNNLENLRSWHSVGVEALQVLGSSEVAPSGELLNQASAQAKMAEEIYTRASESGKISDSDTIRIVRIFQDLVLKKEALQAGGNGNVHVLVSTRVAGTVTSEFEVYSRPWALDAYRLAFQSESSPASTYIPVADYWFWAEKPGFDCPPKERAIRLAPEQGDTEIFLDCSAAGDAR